MFSSGVATFIMISLESSHFNFLEHNFNKEIVVIIAKFDRFGKENK